MARMLSMDTDSIKKDSRGSNAQQQQQQQQIGSAAAASSSYQSIVTTNDDDRARQPTRGLNESRYHKFDEPNGHSIDANMLVAPSTWRWLGLGKLKITVSAFKKLN